MARFRKAHTRAFCYSIRDKNYRQMRAYALLRNPAIIIWYIRRIGDWF